MHGNVAETCQDWYDAGYYASSPSDDPAGPATGADRLTRGGTYGGQAFCRSSARGHSLDGAAYGWVGFRAVLDPQDLVTRGLVGWWKLDESAGQTIATDSSGNGNDGTLTDMDPATDWVTGKIGGALDFDGSNDSVDCGTGVDVANSSFSVCGWLKRASSGSQHVIVGQGPMSTNSSLLLGFNGGDNLMFAFYSNDLYTAGAYTDTTQWHLLAGTFDTSTGARKIYWDGVEVATETGAANYAGTGTFWIGRTGYSTSWFHGPIDDVRVYDRALSAGEIQALHGAGQ
jgi:hypothetical protein